MGGSAEHKTLYVARLQSTKVLLPGQTTREQVPHPDGSVVAIEPWEQNQIHTWPESILSTIREGMVELVNNTSEPITLGADVKTCKIWAMEDSEENDQNFGQNSEMQNCQD